MPRFTRKVVTSRFGRGYPDIYDSKAYAPSFYREREVEGGYSYLGGRKPRKPRKTTTTRYYGKGPLGGQEIKRKRAPSHFNMLVKDAMRNHPGMTLPEASHLISTGRL